MLSVNSCCGQVLGVLLGRAQTVGWAAVDIGIGTATLGLVVRFLWSVARLNRSIVDDAKTMSDDLTDYQHDPASDFPMHGISPLGEPVAHDLIAEAYRADRAHDFSFLC